MYVHLLFDPLLYLYYILTDPYDHSLMLSGSPPGLKRRSYTPTNNLFSEQNTPDTLQMTPVPRMHASVRRSLPVSRPLSSLRWHKHGSMSVMAAPVTLPVRPISRENLGTIRARRYAVISRATRTSRAGRETAEPSASVGRVEGLGSGLALWSPSVFLVPSEPFLKHLIF